MTNKNSVNAVFNSYHELVTDNGLQILYILNPIRAALAAMGEKGGV